MTFKLALFRSALSCALVLSLAGMASADEYKDGVIFCKGTVLKGVDEDDAFLSVTLPTSKNSITSDKGNVYDVTIWNLGTIFTGGVYDSFYNGGPGYFRVQNTGNYPAYVYISTGTRADASLGGGYRLGYDDTNAASYLSVAEQLFGGGEE